MATLPVKTELSTETLPVEKISRAPARDARLFSNQQPSKTTAPPVAMSKAPPKAPPTFSRNEQLMKSGPELLMYPAPPPKVQRFATKSQFRMVGLTPPTHRIPPPRSALPPELPLELPPVMVKPSRTAEALVVWVRTTWYEFSALPLKFGPSLPFRSAVRIEGAKPKAGRSSGEDSPPAKPP